MNPRQLTGASAAALGIKKGGGKPPPIAGVKRGKLLSLSSLPLSHLSTNIVVDAPDEGEAAEGAQSSQCGEAADHHLDAVDGGSSLVQTCVGQSGIVADSSDDQNGSGRSDGGTDTAGQGEEAVDGALVTLAGEVLV